MFAPCHLFCCICRNRTVSRLTDRNGTQRTVTSSQRNRQFTERRSNEDSQTYLQHETRQYSNHDIFSVRLCFSPQTIRLSVCLSVRGSLSSSSSSLVSVNVTHECGRISLSRSRCSDGGGLGRSTLSLSLSLSLLQRTFFFELARESLIFPDTSDRSIDEQKHTTHPPERDETTFVVVVVS